MDCRIVGLNQGMDFETNSSQTFLVLELPDGQRVQAAIDDETATKVITLQIQANGVPHGAAGMPSAPIVPPDLEEREDSNDQAFVFGGSEDVVVAPDNAPEYNEPPDLAPLEEDAQEEPPPPRQETPREARKRARKNGSVPSRSVPRDAMGYPVVQGPDPAALTTPHNQDEDGVGSI